jgi:hypothetical protein
LVVLTRCGKCPARMATGDAARVQVTQRRETGVAAARVAALATTRKRKRGGRPTASFPEARLRLAAQCAGSSPALPHWSIPRGPLLPPTGLQLRPDDEPAPLFCDLYDRSTNTIVEAKGSVTRPAFRMAIGQLADYSRLVDPAPSKVILVPTEPRADLVQLAASQGIDVTWRDERGDFARSAKATSSGKPTQSPDPAGHHQGDARRQSQAPGPQIRAISSRTLQRTPSLRTCTRSTCDRHAAGGTEVRLTPPTQTTDATPRKRA